MRKAIQSTNVVLDMTIIPEVVLVPSSMIILNKPLPGYNNVLTTATREMGFGKNDKINFQGFVKKKKKAPKSPESPETFPHTLTLTRQESEESEPEEPTTPAPP